ncbi:MAG: sensor histidine kinase, partial [Phenylobacterium sp.]|nr:sensor histidine kinase [Phenylobacterium sp.]
MAEAIKAPGRAPSLLRQIAVRLTALMAIFALLDVAIVVSMYAFDRQALAEDLIEQQAHRVDRALAVSPESAADLPDPIGVSTWNYIVVDARLRPVLQRQGPSPQTLSMWPDASTLDWTRRSTAGTGTQVTGARRFSSRDGPYWILIEANV